ncbi:hypothetical protein J6590_094729 [Homalodisca vitripennis]|nr:hypothetical protein J6590_081100 [Homalodisca vitripennis]KAG8334254.1 hypothetical protein J6590_094729 [Homalodisca vitripennis]
MLTVKTKLHLTERPAVFVDDVLLEEAYSTKLCSPKILNILLWPNSPTLSVWGKTLERLLQKKAIRIIGKLNYRESCRESFRELKLLTLPCLYIYDVIIVRGEDIHRYETRGRDNYRAQQHRLTLTQHLPQQGTDSWSFCLDPVSIARSHSRFVVLHEGSRLLHITLLNSVSTLLSLNLHLRRGRKRKKRLVMALSAVEVKVFKSQAKDSKCTVLLQDMYGESVRFSGLEGSARETDMERLLSQLPLEVSIRAMSFSTTGILVTLFVAGVFVRHNETPVVKAAGRELSYVLLTGILLCYLVTFALVLRPTNAVCGIQRYVSW